MSGSETRMKLPKHYRESKFAALQLGDMEYIKKLFTAENVNQSINKYEDRPLHYAVYSQMADVAKHLISLGANAKIRNTRGFTPLDLAERVGNKDILAELRKAATNQKGEEEGKAEVNTQAALKEYLSELAQEAPKEETKEKSTSIKMEEVTSVIVNPSVVSGPP